MITAQQARDIQKLPLYVRSIDKWILQAARNGLCSTSLTVKVADVDIISTYLYQQGFQVSIMPSKKEDKRYVEVSW